MARVVAFVPDLLFGSRIVSALQAAGHDVELKADLQEGVEDADILIVDLTADPEERIERAKPLAVPKLAFYSHVEPEVRDRAEAAGFDAVVPRSRMAREGAELTQKVLSR